MPTPYYDNAGITIYHGDCREILPSIARVDLVLTDPVWPNSSPHLAGSERPLQLFAEAMQMLPRCRGLAVHLGCDSDPRILASVPARLRFLRTCWLEYACPTRKGRVLYTGDVAYIYGAPVKAAHGRHLMPGRITSTRPDRRRSRVTPHKEWGAPLDDEHPCPRRFEHVRWLAGRFADGRILDPFCGSGTTLLAAKDAGYPAIGIEINERYCEIAATRLAQGALNFEEVV